MLQQLCPAWAATQNLDFFSTDPTGSAQHRARSGTPLALLRPANLGEKCSFSVIVEVLGQGIDPPSFRLSSLYSRRAAGIQFLFSLSYCCSAESCKENVGRGAGVGPSQSWFLVTPCWHENCFPLTQKALQLLCCQFRLADIGNNNVLSFHRCQEIPSQAGLTVCWGLQSWHLYSKVENWQYFPGSQSSSMIHSWGKDKMWFAKIQALKYQQLFIDHISDLGTKAKRRFFVFFFFAGALVTEQCLSLAFLNPKFLGGSSPWAMAVGRAQSDVL